MYTIKAFVDGKEYMIHNPRVKALIVGDPYQLNVSLHAGNARNGANYFWPGVFSESIYTSGREVCIRGRPGGRL